MRQLALWEGIWLAQTVLCKLSVTASYDGLLRVIACFAEAFRSDLLMHYLMFGNFCYKILQNISIDSTHVWVRYLGHMLGIQLWVAAVCRAVSYCVLLEWVPKAEGEFFSLA